MAVGDLWSVNLTVYDGSKHRSIVSFNLDGTLDFVNVQDWADAVVTLVENITDGDVRIASIARIAGYFTAGSATEQSDVENGAKFIWTVLTTAKRAINRIPCFRQGYMLDNSDIVDVAETNVAAFITALTDGIDTTDEDDVKAVDSEGRAYDGLWTANEDFQRTRKPVR